MILQYKGFNNNWSYEQANSITWAEVHIGNITMEYRGKELIGDGEWYKEMLFRIDEFIQSETKCSDELKFSLQPREDYRKIENVYVVTLKDKSKNITYVFDSGVYLLNDSGGTVQKIA